MLAEWLDCFQAVLKALEVYPEMLALDQWFAECGTVEVHQNLLGGHYVPAMVVYILDIIGLLLSLGVSLVLYWLVLGCETGKHLEMVAAKEGNYTMWVDETNLWVVQN